jgi:hypothetical protein
MMIAYTGDFLNNGHHNALFCHKKNNSCNYMIKQLMLRFIMR